MFKIWMRHYLHEVCLDILFNNVCKNFNRTPLPNIVPKIGDRYSKISHIYGDEHYYNCYILDVEPRSTDSKTYYLIHVSYETTSVDQVDLSEVDYSEYIDEDNTITDDELKDLFDSGDMENIDMDGMVMINSNYYTFTK